MFDNTRRHGARMGTLMGAAFVAAAIGAPAVAQAAKLTLGNGDQVTGEIIELKDQTLKFKSPLFGEVKIPWAQVAELRSDEGVRVQLADGTQVQGQLVVQADGKAVITPGAATSSATTARELPRGDVALLSPPVPSTATKYTGHATLGGTFNRGNTRDDALNIDAELVARAPEYRYTLNAEAHQASSTGVTTTANRMLSGQYDKFLNPKDYLFANAKAQVDRQADLTLRSTVGAGYGRQFVETEEKRLSAQVGLSYVNENYQIAGNKSFPALNVGLNYEQKFFDNRLVLFNKSDVAVSLSNTQDTLLKNQLGFRVPIANGLNFSTQLNLAYDHSPPPGVKRTDTSLVVGVGYAF